MNIIQKYILKNIKESPFSNRIAMIDKDNNRITWRDYSIDSLKFALSLLLLNITNSGVVIHCYNSPEWFITYMGCILSSNYSSGIYLTNSPEQCQHILTTSKSKVLVVDTYDNFINNYKEIFDKDKKMIAIIIEKSIKIYNNRIYQWNNFLKNNINLNEWHSIYKRKTTKRKDSLVTLIYTSGTTSNPKPVEIRVSNINFVVQSIIKKYFQSSYDLISSSAINKNEYIVLSYLPLSHIAAQIIDLVTHLFMYGTVYFTDTDVMSNLGDYLLKAKPTLFFGVPRVWEKIKEKMESNLEKHSFIKKNIIKTSRFSHNFYNNKFTSIFKISFLYLLYLILNLFVLKSIKKKLGFDRCKYFISGGAPLDKLVINYFSSFNVNIGQIYGMSETTGIITLPNSNYKIGSNGMPLIGTNVKIVNNEILVKGPNVTKGYFNMLKETNESISNGWLKTGDLGKLDKQGNLFIIGRKKELVITSGGENIPALLIENRIKSYDKNNLIIDSMLIGNKRKYLTIIIVSDEENDEKIKVIIDKYNKNAISRAQNIQKWYITKTRFTIQNDLLTNTLKKKRNKIEKYFENEINDMYN